MIASAAALTQAQRAAVDHAGGPLLIVAGAGTGKTRVLVERYRRLRQEGVPAERILLLTFTEKAAREVLDRVEQEDYLPAGERFVLTYHAFAQRFLQEEGWLGGIPKGFRIVSEVRKWEVMRDVLLGQRPPHLFHAQRPYERIGELLKLVERAKQELVSPMEFRAWADANAGATGGDPVLAAQREAALVYAEYQERLLGEDPDRLEKRLTATRGEGRPLSVLTATNVTEEADAVATLVKTAIDEGRHRPNAIAILLRANAHLHNFARALQRRGVAYQVSGGRGFYQQPEIKDCLAYLRAVDHPDDTVCLMRLLSLPRYAADPVQAGRWSRQARDDGRRFFDLLQESTDDGACRLTRDLRQFGSLALRLGVDDLFYEVMEQTHYLDLERFLGPIERLHVSANVQKLAELIAAYCDEHPDHHLAAYLKHLDATEAAQADEEIAPLDETVNAVHLMTVHQAKGLEFGLVIIPHLVEGRFPASRRGEGLTLPNELLKEELPAAELHLAEERRLAYVALTRAREEIVCTLASRYG